MRLALVVALATVPLAAQGLVSGHVSVNPVASGATTSFTLTNASGASLILNAGCAYTTVRQGLPTGPIVFMQICNPAAVSLAPCATATTGFTPAPSLAPGL